MFRGLESVGVIFLIFAVGFFFQQKKIWPDNTPPALSSIVTRISAPCLAVTSIVAGYDRETLAGSFVMMIIAFLHLMIMMSIGKGSARLLGLGGGRKTVFEISFTFSNVIFIGLPINQIVFGTNGLLPLFAYYLIGLACFWSFGVYQIASAAPDAPEINKKSAISAGKILNPGLIGVLVGYILVQAELGLPPVLDIALGYLANLTIPLSLLIIGANLTMFAKGIPRITKDEILVILAKFAISPLIMLVLLKIFGVTGLPFFVYLLSSTMPCHMQASIIAQNYNVEPSYASKLVGLTTLLSIITIPCYAFLIHTLMLQVY